jgi:hypothetical protein
LHEKKFSPSQRSQVTAICIDGHEKVLQRLCETDGPPPMRAGRPHADGTTKMFTNGWFMASDPGSGRVLSVEPMSQPENNEVAIKTLEKVIHLYPKVHLVIFDRACKLKKAASQRPKLRQVKMYATDKWHGSKHSKTCPCSHLHNPSIRKAVDKHNPSVAEQIFSWFRTYAGTFNSMRPERHRFSVLSYVRRHNDMVDAGDTEHLNAFASRKAAASHGEGYACARKRPAASA